MLLCGYACSQALHPSAASPKKLNVQFQLAKGGEAALAATVAASAAGTRELSGWADHSVLSASPVAGDGRTATLMAPPPPPPPMVPPPPPVSKPGDVEATPNGAGPGQSTRGQASSPGTAVVFVSSGHPALTSAPPPPVVSMQPQPSPTQPSRIPRRLANGRPPLASPPRRGADRVGNGGGVPAAKTRWAIPWPARISV